MSHGPGLWTEANQGSFPGAGCRQPAGDYTSAWAKGAISLLLEPEAGWSSMMLPAMCSVLWLHGYKHGTPRGQQLRADSPGWD